LILYRSRAAIDLSAEQLTKIASVSAEKNKRLSITGFLVEFDGLFLQALEGPDQAVEALMMQIERDSRHREVRTLLARTVSGRQFGFWGMNWGPLSDPQFRSAALGGELTYDEFIGRTDDPSFVHQVLFRSYLHALDLAKGNAAAREAVVGGLV
jgi:hypothetical protein